MATLLFLAPLNAEAGRKKDKPLFDARTMFMLPLRAPDMPMDVPQMRLALLHGFKQQLQFANEDSAVVIEGGIYPHVDKLQIDLTNARGDASKKQATPSYKTPRATMHVNHLSMIGQPYLFENRKLNMSLTASDVSLIYNLDKDGEPALIITEVGEGKLEFEMTMDDLRALVLEQAKELGGSYGVGIKKTTVNIVAPDERSLWVEMKAEGSWGNGFQLNGRLDVDDQMNAKTSGLLLDGNGWLGNLVVGLAGGDMTEYEGRTVPLMRFPTKKMVLKDVRFHVDETLKITAIYGRAS